jgi:hypothetical protein
MDKYAAGKIEGMLLMILSNLDYVAHHFREASPRKNSATACSRSGERWARSSICHGIFIRNTQS